MRFGIAVWTLMLLCAASQRPALAAYAPSVALPMFAHEPSMDGRIDASWTGAALLRLGYDFTNHRHAAQPTSVYVAQDPTGLDIAFVSTQRQGVKAATLTNGAAVLNDDNVGVFISPQGTQGFSYAFYANAKGARTQTSSENTAYTPSWTAAGDIASPGYTVTMHIPFAIIRSNGSKHWSVQFVRFNLSSDSYDVWSHSALATSTSDATFFGSLTGVGANLAKGTTAPKRPAARFQPYALGVARSSAAGGATSQIGLDMAIPVTPTASFVGSFHPDYSNVETDQQTISPTAFPRQYQEVRPFFTQVGNAFNSTFGCLDCPQSIYTPSIPTFRQGYGLEGTQGPINFSGFDAVGSQRTDAAGAIDFSHASARNVVSLNAQRISVSTPGFTDSTTSLNAGYFDQRNHLFLYGNYAREAGTFVSDPAQARYGEIGAGYKDANTVFVAARQYVGAQYSPADGYVQQSDIGGYIAYAQHTVHFARHSPLQDISINANDSRYVNHLSLPAQSNAGYQVNFDLKNLWTLHVYQQSTFVLTSAGQYLPFSDGNGAFIGYDQNSNFPIGLAYSTGAYYHGRAASWQFNDTLPLRRKVSLSLNLNENIYASRDVAEPSFRQWLNSASVNWQFSPDASLALGARRINGVSLPYAFAPPVFTPIFADNLSAAFHYLRGHNEFYLVYGDPNALVTTPAVYFKWIFYAGAEKGT
ncbi:MAG: DOMON domain-containing protein [Vulcanimicrobiaceae bacterium]